VQQDLIAGAAGRPPAHPAVQGMDAERFLQVVQGLMGHVLASHGWPGLADAPPAPSMDPLWIRPVQAVWRGRLPRWVGTGALAVVAAVVAEAADNRRDDILSWVWSPAVWGLRPVRFAEVGPAAKYARAAMAELARTASGPLRQLLMSASARQQNARLAFDPGGWEASRYAAWARALLGDDATRLKGKRGREWNKVISRLARTAVLRQEAAGSASLSVKWPTQTDHRADRPPAPLPSAPLDQTCPG
jgi:hypothetical protein